METKRLMTPFRAIDFAGIEYDLKSIENVIKYTTDLGEERYIRGVIEYKTAEGEPVISLGHNNFEISGKNGARIQVIRMNSTGTA